MANSSSEKPRRFKIEIRNILQDPWLIYPSTERMQVSWRVSLWNLLPLSRKFSPSSVRNLDHDGEGGLRIRDETKIPPSLDPMHSGRIGTIGEIRMCCAAIAIEGEIPP